MPLSEYKLLDQDQGSSDESDPCRLEKPVPIYRSKRCFLILVIALFSSLTLNFILASQRLRNSTEGPSKYAGIKKDTTVGFTHISPFINKDRKIQNAAWRAPELNPDLGLVALSNEFSTSMGLPNSQPWPWDTNKKIYYINGFHSMHCVHALRVTVHEAFEGKTPTIPEGHMLHCLDVLREEVMCAADDTPRYTGRVNAEVGMKVATSGNGQTRVCRNWDTLVKWAIENSACYEYVNNTVPDFPELERYKHCPDGRVFWPE